MNNDNIDELAKECGLGSIYERPVPIEVNGQIKWESSGEITPFGYSLIRFFKESESLRAMTEAEFIAETLKHLIPRANRAGKISTLNYKHVSCTYDPNTNELKIADADGKKG